MGNPAQTNRKETRVDSIGSTCSYLAILLAFLLLLSTITSNSSFGVRATGLIQNKLSIPSHTFLNPAGNVSTYLDQNHTIPSTSFAAGSTVYVKGEGWPTRVNLIVNFTSGNVGEISVPILVSSTDVQTDGVGSFASNLKLAANGPPGVWIVYAELTPSTVSSSRFVVYLPPRTLPSFLIPGLIIGLGVAGLVGYLYLRRRADQKNYYTNKGRSQG